MNVGEHKATNYAVRISRYYPARLVAVGWPWLDPQPVGALQVRIQIDQDFASLLRENCVLRHATSDYLHGLLNPAMTTTTTTSGKEKSLLVDVSHVCGMVERALRNRARFAIEQYNWACKHLESIPIDQKDRLSAAVKLEVRYVMTLLMQPKDHSVELLRLYTNLETLAKHDFGGENEVKNIVV